MTLDRPIRLHAEPNSFRCVVGDKVVDERQHVVLRDDPGRFRAPLALKCENIQHPALLIGLTSIERTAP